MILEAKNLTKHFTVAGGKTLHAVDNVSLGLEKNEVLGLVGESGSGKTTLGKTIVGLYEKTAGEVWYMGKKLPMKYDAYNYRQQARDLQFIFQDPYSSLNPRMTVFEIVAEGLALRKEMKSAQLKEQAAYWLERVGLSADHMSRYPHEFSGGQRQRVGIARALIVEPKVVVCDEPISALDVSVQAQIVHLLDELRSSLGLSIIFIAHDLSMVRFVSDRMAVMYLGSVVETGTADSIYFAPKHPYTKILIESNPEADPVREQQHKTPAIKGEIPSPVNLPKGCRFAGRCPIAEKHCFFNEPQLREIEDGRQVACHLV